MLNPYIRTEDVPNMLLKHYYLVAVERILEKLQFFVTYTQIVIIEFCTI